MPRILEDVTSLYDGVAVKDRLYFLDRAEASLRDAFLCGSSFDLSPFTVFTGKLESAEKLEEMLDCLIALEKGMKWAVNEPLANGEPNHRFLDPKGIKGSRKDRLEFLSRMKTIMLESGYQVFEFMASKAGGRGSEDGMAILSPRSMRRLKLAPEKAKNLFESGLENFRLARNPDAWAVYYVLLDDAGCDYVISSPRFLACKKPIIGRENAERALREIADEYGRT